MNWDGVPQMFRIIYSRDFSDEKFICSKSKHRQLLEKALAGQFVVVRIDERASVFL